MRREIRRRNQLRLVAATVVGILVGIFLLVAKKMPVYEGWGNKRSEPARVSSAPEVDPGPKKKPFEKTPVSAVSLVSDTPAVREPAPKPASKTETEPITKPAPKPAPKPAAKTPHPPTPPAPRPGDRKPSSPSQDRSREPKWDDRALWIVFGPNARPVVKACPRDLKFDHKSLQSLAPGDLRGRLRLMLHIHADSSLWHYDPLTLPVDSSGKKAEPKNLTTFLFSKAGWRRSDGRDFDRQVEFIVDFDSPQ